MKNTLIDRLRQGLEMVYGEWSDGIEVDRMNGPNRCRPSKYDIEAHERVCNEDRAKMNAQYEADRRALDRLQVLDTI
jgi:hypothetical protein